MIEQRPSRSNWWAASLVSVVLLGACQNRRTEAEPAVKASSTSAPAASSREVTTPAKSLFGAAIEGSTSSSLAEVLREPEPFVGKKVLVEGEVRRACSRKGCWMELATAADPAAPGLRVTFLDYGFFVPTNSAGSHARVEGQIEVKDVSKAHVDHLESEGATFSNKLPDGSAKEVRFIATGVELSRG